MNFDLNKSIALLERTPKAMRSLFYDLPFDWNHINEGPNTWSVFDIMGHLIHGELTDWIPRARIILSEEIQDKTFVPFDRFAQEKTSVGKSIQQLIDEFESLRIQNIDTMKSWKLGDKELELKGIHPDLGEVNLRQLIASWTVHDMSHLYQISRVFVKHYGEDVGPWSNYIRILKEN
ncbi:MAG: DinB family protein [Bacteroidia bacterium]|nr:DinB family protein [Bacteroidia bacterium]